MRMLVTGGAGFIGSHFVRQMLGREDVERVIVLDIETYAGVGQNLNDVRRNPRLLYIRGDIRDRSDVEYVVRRCNVIVHFAAESHVDRSIQRADDFMTTNVVGTQVLVDAAIRHGVKRFVHVSTDEVYGSIEEGSWTEDAPLAPRSPYAASKAASDLVVLAAHHTHGLDAVITRGSNTYGPYQYPEKLIPHFTTRLLRGQCAPLYGDGMNEREWMHVEDHVSGIQAALEHGESGQVYHLGGQPLTNTVVTLAILETLGLGWDRVCPVEDRKGHDRRYSLDTTRAARELGFTPVHDTIPGIAETVAWYRDHTQWWDTTMDQEDI